MREFQNGCSQLLASCSESSFPPSLLSQRIKYPPPFSSYPFKVNLATRLSAGWARLRAINTSAASADLWQRSIGASSGLCCHLDGHSCLLLFFYVWWGFFDRSFWWLQVCVWCEGFTHADLSVIFLDCLTIWFWPLLSVRLWYRLLPSWYHK